VSTYTSDLVRERVRACNPKIIVECGTCNGEDTIDMAKVYRPNKLYTFEANPENHQLCREVLAPYPYIQFEAQAVNDITGFTQFYPGDREKCRFPNGGISSMYPFKPGHSEFALKEAITIPCTRLDDYLMAQGVCNVDLVCMDVQGAELKALHGLGTYLHTVQVIIAEVWYKTYYDGSPVYSELVEFLRSYGFKAIDLFRYDDYGDAMWVKE